MYKSLLQRLKEELEVDLSHIPSNDIQKTEEQFDFSHIPSSESEQTQEKVPTQSMRLLGIDKTKINDVLKQLAQNQTIIPLTKIKEELAKFKVEIIEHDDLVKKKSGDVAYDLKQNGKLVKNVKLHIYWNKTKDGLDLNIYIG